MKSTFLLLVFTIACHLTGIAQDFSFKMYFEDAIGNRDTLTIGYDSLGTDSIDTFFGEQNIIALPMDSIFEVRISDALFNPPGTFQTKKQILTNPCGGSSNIVSTIDILCQNWPINVTWDSNPFQQYCLRNSVITDYHPGGWFDVPNDFVVCLRASNSIAVSNQDNYTYQKNGDTIHMIFVGIGDAVKFSIGGPSCLILSSENHVNKSAEIGLYPNPTNDKLRVDISNSNLQVSDIRLTDLIGRHHNVELKSGHIYLGHLPSGIYLLKITLSNGETIAHKVIKDTP